MLQNCIYCTRKYLENALFEFCKSLKFGVFQLQKVPEIGVEMSVRTVDFVAGTCVTGNNQIFLAGGSIRKLGRMNGRHATVPECMSSDVWVLNVNQRKWEQRASMSRARCQFSLVVVDE